MPIDYKKYHPNWKSEIRPRILARANNRCENCGLKNYSVGYRRHGVFIPVPFIKNYNSPPKDFTTYKDAKAFADKFNKTWDDKLIVIVLTIAHINHDTSENEDKDLAALCQQCHNRHDAQYRSLNKKLKNESRAI
ncbi:MAG TPA: hypothetical protein PLP63_06465 [Saprospiraceae bacterium]|nr:hypothetical protein [Saprospiraceae bacterium]